MGVKVIRNNNEVILSQKHYIEKLLKRDGNYDVTPVKTPFDANTQLKKNLDDLFA